MHIVGGSLSPVRGRELWDGSVAPVMRSTQPRRAWACKAERGSRMAACSTAPTRDTSPCRSTRTRDRQAGREGSLGRKVICKLTQLNASRTVDRGGRRPWPSLTSTPKDESFHCNWLAFLVVFWGQHLTTLISRKATFPGRLQAPHSPRAKHTGKPRWFFSHCTPQSLPTHPQSRGATEAALGWHTRHPGHSITNP